ncbi:MAG: radical SAM protein [Methanomassiliicoccales archaeon]|nr:radical SAM protein [Methanomassiliicoccales archaeon]NYT15126.1 radical SAM protein [Methanomassiliicoccales archaeon]
MRITFDLSSFNKSQPLRSNGVCRYLETGCSKALSPSRLPGLDWALNPYIGCEHGCTYCYVPSIMNMDRREWGQLVKIKRRVPNLLAKELKRTEGIIGVGTVTDPYQPIEKKLELTRKCLDLISHSHCTVSVHTKSDLIVRDADILRAIPGSEVGVTITTIDQRMAKYFEPNAPSPENRLGAMRDLVNSEVDTYALIAPMIPLVTDIDLEALVGAIDHAGVGKVMIDPLRLRDGMLDNLISILQPIEYFNSGLFKEMITSKSYFHELEDRIIHICQEFGIECVSAF